MSAEGITWRKAFTQAGLLVLMGVIIGWSVSLYVENQALADSVEANDRLFYEGLSQDIAEVLDKYCAERVYDPPLSEGYEHFYNDGKLAVYETSEGEEKLMLWCANDVHQGSATGDYLVEENQ